RAHSHVGWAERSEAHAERSPSGTWARRFAPLPTLQTRSRQRGPPGQARWGRIGRLRCQPLLIMNSSLWGGRPAKNKAAAKEESVSEIAPRAAMAPEMPLPRWVPALLSFVAGYVDIYTFLALFGLFVAQETGSFVTAGAELVTHDTGIIGKAIAIVAF